MKVNQYIQVGLFVAALLAVGAMQFLGVGLNGEKVNRKIDFPSATISEESSEWDQLLSLRDNWDAFYKSSFSLESDFFEYYSHMESNWYGVNAIPEKVLEGNDGWLFLGDNFSDAFSESKGYLQLRQGEVNFIKKRASLKRDWLKEREIGFYVAMAPNKLSVYDDKLPITKLDTVTKYEQVIQVLEELEIPIIDMGANFDKHLDQDLYFKNDSHWNALGAYWGYRALMDEIVKKYPQVNIVKEEDFVFKEEVISKGDLIKMLKVDRKEKVPVLEYKNPRSHQIPSLLCIPSYYKQNPSIYEYRYKSDVNDLKVILLGDSFGAGLREYLKESFGEVIVIRSSFFDRRILMQEQPDIVINEFVERMVDNVNSALR